MPIPVTGRELALRYEALMLNVLNDAHASGIESALMRIASDGEVRRAVPRSTPALEHYQRAKEAGDPEALEAAFLGLYIALHSAGASYTIDEDDALSARMGIECTPGGVMPVIMASCFAGRDSVVADLGSGNGLQGLLLQDISPHRKTLQIELSSSMIATGRLYQRALGIGDDRMEWFNGDIADAPFDTADVIYLYRPARPMPGGNELYREIGRRLSASAGPLAVISVADCLGRFLDSGFRVFYGNEHLTCFLKG